MIPIRVHLQSTAEPAGKPAAWLLPGDDPLRWLTEIATWPGPHADIRLLILPRRPNDRRAARVLAIPPQPHRAAPDCLPYRQVGPQLYLPQSSEVHPPVDDDEWRSLLEGGRLYVWLPDYGLLEFAEDDVVTPAQLLDCPTAIGGEWQHGVPGVALNRRLWSIEVKDDSGLEQLLREGGDDIGQQSPQELPPSPSEPASGLTGIGHQLQQTLAGLIRRTLARDAGASARDAAGPGAAGAAGSGTAGSRAEAAGSAGGNWRDRLVRWANDVLSAGNSPRQDSRNREYERLIHMLETDMDRGLQYAMPLSGGGASRGLAYGGSQLTPHDTDFRLDGLGGGPIAGWWAPQEVYGRLSHLYREAAERELRLGRFRRAAYILASLLGDFEGAVGALRQGGYYREAGLILRDRLSRPQEAADCFEKARMWTEALELHLQYNQYERAAEISLRIGQTEQARDLFRRAASTASGGGDYLRAARIYHERLEDVELALHELQSAWPYSAQNVDCLRQYFRLLKQYGREREALPRIEEWRRTPLALEHRLQLMKLLVEVQQDAVNEEVRFQSADTVVLLAAEILPRATAPQTREVMTRLQELATNDHLLERDCFRFQTATQKRAGPAKRKALPKGRLQRVAKFAFLGGIEWRTMTVMGDAIYAAGFQQGALILQRVDVSTGKVQTALAPHTPIEPRFLEWPILMVPLEPPARRVPAGRVPARRVPARRVLVQVIGAAPRPMQHFPAQGDMPMVLIGGAPGVDAETFGAAPVADDRLLVLGANRDTRQLAMKLITSEGAPVAYWFQKVLRKLGPSPATLQTHAVPLHVASGHVYAAWGPLLAVLRPVGDSSLISVEHSIGSLSVCGDDGGGPAYVALGMQYGAMVHWLREGRREYFAPEMRDAVVGQTLGRDVVVADANACEVYDAASGRLRLAGKSLMGYGRPLAIFSTDKRDEFRIGYADGQIRTFEVLRGRQ